MNTRKARALISLDADSTPMAKGLADAKKRLRGFAKEAKGLLGKGLGGAKSILGGAAGLLSGGLGIQAAGGLTDMLGDVIAFEKSLTRFQIASGKSSTEMAALRNSIIDVSKATGVAATEILGGAQTYVDLTGDVKGAEAAMTSFARIAQASGSSVSDIAGAAAALSQAGVEAKNFEATFSGLIAQGKKGAVGLKDFAGELASLLPRWAKFNEGTTVTGISQLGAAFQVARQGFGSASEAATGLEALMGALSLNAKKFAAANVKLFDVDKKGVKTFVQFDQILDSIGKSSLMKDPTKLTKALGSKEASQTLDMLIRAKQTATDTGNAFSDMVAAGEDIGAVGRDLDTYLTSPAGKLEVAFQNIKAAVAEALTPERIAAFADALVKVADTLVVIIKGIESLAKGLDAKDMTTRYRTKALVAAASGLTPDEKREAAHAALKQAAILEQTGSGMGDEVKAESNRRAADIVLGQADEEDAARVMAGNFKNAFEKAVIQAVSGWNLTLKADDNTLAKTTGNAAANRKPGGA
jgi:TP901 family phage tail tape measure protein